LENNEQDLNKLIAEAVEVTEMSDAFDSGTEKDYIDANITPLLSIINLLGNVSANLATSVDTLQTTYVVNPKKSELKDTIDLIYNINEKCEDIYDVLKKRIHPLLHKNTFANQ
jgi:hypothetical protein